jgi:casein kinase II subunit beta
MRANSRNFIARVAQISCFSIYSGPCKSCPSSTEPWIKQFCSQNGNSWYVPVEADWASDWFNTHGIKELFPDYDLAVELISDKHSDDWIYLSDEAVASILMQATQVYGLIHQRWICQTRGMSQMRKAYDKGIFGKCPRFSCHDQLLLPVGTTLRPRRHSVKVFCPQCCDIYLAPADVKLDGAHFGPAFPSIFLFEYPELDQRRQFKQFIHPAYGFMVDASRGRFEPHATNNHTKEMPCDTGNA